MFCGRVAASSPRTGASRRPGLQCRAGHPEDDPRNAATIADNVGDNVGAAPAWSAYLFESLLRNPWSLAAAGAVASVATPVFPLIIPRVLTALPVVSSRAPRW